jgi:hypothetical protein
MKRLIGAIARLDALMDIGELTRTLALAAP